MSYSLIQRRWDPICGGEGPVRVRAHTLMCENALQNLDGHERLHEVATLLQRARAHGVPAELHVQRHLP